MPVRVYCAHSGQLLERDAAFNSAEVLLSKASQKLGSLAVQAGSNWNVRSIKELALLCEWSPKGFVVPPNDVEKTAAAFLVDPAALKAAVTAKDSSLYLVLAKLELDITPKGEPSSRVLQGRRSAAELVEVLGGAQGLGPEAPSLLQFVESLKQMLESGEAHKNATHRNFSMCQRCKEMIDVQQRACITASESAALFAGDMDKWYSKHVAEFKQLAVEAAAIQVEAPDISERLKATEIPQALRNRILSPEEEVTNMHQFLSLHGRNVDQQLAFFRLRHEKFQAKVADLGVKLQEAVEEINETKKCSHVLLSDRMAVVESMLGKFSESDKKCSDFVKEVAKCLESLQTQVGNKPDSDNLSQALTSAMKFSQLYKQELVHIKEQESLSPEDECKRTITASVTAVEGHLLRVSKAQTQLKKFRTSAREFIVAGTAVREQCAEFKKLKRTPDAFRAWIVETARRRSFIAGQQIRANRLQLGQQAVLQKEQSLREEFSRQYWEALPPEMINILNEEIPAIQIGTPKSETKLPNFAGSESSETSYMPFKDEECQVEDVDRAQLTASLDVKEHELEQMKSQMSQSRKQASAHVVEIEVKCHSLLAALRQVAVAAGIPDDFLLQDVQDVTHERVMDLATEVCDILEEQNTSLTDPSEGQPSSRG